jgi:Arm DNA-binding domain
VTRQLNRLTARMVATLKKTGRHADGGNLYVRVTRLRSAALSKSFTFMYLFEGKQREAGLGSCDAITLADARAKAAEYRLLLSKGIDPLDAKKATQEAAAARKTFGECAAELIKSKSSEWRSAIHAAQWRTTIDDYCGPILDKPVDAIDTQAVLGVLQPVWAGFQKPRHGFAAGSRQS